MVTTQEFQRKYERLSDRSVTPSSEADIDADCLMAFDYEYQGQDAEVEIDTDEFTAVCPWTCLPDFGTLRINYVPDRLCIELKSLKLYLLAYRQEGIFYEAVTNQILADLVTACQPRRMTVTGDFRPRGGISTVVTADYAADV